MKPSPLLSSGEFPSHEGGVRRRVCHVPLWRQRLWLPHHVRQARAGRSFGEEAKNQRCLNIDNKNYNNHDFIFVMIMQITIIFLMTKVQKVKCKLHRKIFLPPPLNSLSCHIFHRCTSLSRVAWTRPSLPWSPTADRFSSLVTTSLRTVTARSLSTQRATVWRCTRTPREMN